MYNDLFMSHNTDGMPSLACEHFIKYLPSTYLVIVRTYFEHLLLFAHTRRAAVNVIKNQHAVLGSHHLSARRAVYITMSCSLVCSLNLLL